MSMAVIHMTRMEVMEMVGRLAISAVRWEAAVIAIAGVKGVIDIPMKAAWAVEPWAGTEEDATIEPFGTVVAVGCAVVGRVVKVTVGANRSRPTDVYAERDLGVCLGGRDQKESECSCCCDEKSLNSTHKDNLRWIRNQITIKSCKNAY
jgi:hypothetical protein